MTRVATPENELVLLQFAQSSTGAQLERICRSFRRVTRPARRAADEERYVRQRHLDSGMVRIEAQLLPDEAELVMKALHEACRAAAGVSAETSPSSENTAEAPTLVDGLVLAAESFLARGPKTRNGGERTQLFVHVTEERLGSDPMFRATLSDGTVLSGPALLRLACDRGIVVAKVDGAGKVLDVGRRQRSIPPALRRALWLRDGGCRFPGCCARAHCEAHHIDHWSFGGPTSLFKTLLLCHYHHFLVHEGGFDIQRDGHGQLIFLAPDGRTIEPVPRAPGVAAARDIWIHPHTNRSRWDGAPLDRETLGSAVGALLARTCISLVEPLAPS